MKIFIIRLVLTAIFFALLHFAANYDIAASTIIAFVTEQILEPLILLKS